MQEIEADKFKDFGELLSALSVQATPQGKDESLKLTFEDVKRLHGTYCALETTIKNTEKQTGAVYINEIESYLICALKYEARNISDERTLEYAEYKAKLEAKEYEETPRYSHPWYRLFRATPNRAQELVNEEAALNADNKHHVKEADLNQLERELEQIEIGTTAGENLSLRKKRKLRNLIKKHDKAMKRLKKKLCADTPAPEEVATVQSEAPPTTAPKTMHEPEHKEKPKTRTKKPVSVIEQLPGQMDIEQVNITN